VCRDATNRDLTINSLLWDPISGEVLDYNNGVKDLFAGRLCAGSTAVGSLIADPSRCIRCAFMTCTHHL
jgi:tRNA nucleotidyltransferase/poly(A) polymerase